MAEAVILIGELLGAIMVIGSFFLGAWRLFKKLNDLSDSLLYNTIETLKLIIINENIPLEERITAGRKYIALGGNGAIKILVHELEKQLAESYVD